MSDPSYPIGKFTYAGPSSAARRRHRISEIENMPAQLRAAVVGLDESQLDTPYRDGGWTVRQVAHHVPDSHMNAFIRFKLALTETEPTIKPYREDLWAKLADVKDTSVDTSLCLLECLHKRWVAILHSITDEEWQRTLRHPELGLLTLDHVLALYAWHGKHHVAHVTTLRKKKGW